MVIGNPAAGKKLGDLSFFWFAVSFLKKLRRKWSLLDSAEHKTVTGFFSTQGILLDTAGRYSVYPEDQLLTIVGFLNILKKNRSKAPVNGLIVIVRIVDLVNQSPEKSLQLAKTLRARLQDLTDV